jgi:adenosine deaminase
VHHSCSLRWAAPFKLLPLLVACFAALGASSCSDCLCFPGGRSEQAASQALDAVRSDPIGLHSFLLRMPKGADLHNHLSGAVYAESFIREAVEDGLMIDLQSLAFIDPKDPQKKFTQEMAREKLPDGRLRYVPAANANSDQNLFDALVDSFSMRSFVPSSGVSGHDHFFATFGKFGAVRRQHTGEWVDEVAQRAAAQNEQYLELMQTPKPPSADKLELPLHSPEDIDHYDVTRFMPVIEQAVRESTEQIKEIDDLRRQRELCGQPQPSSTCQVEVRYIYQVARGKPKEQVFAQALLGFALASANTRVVGINLVMPEDGHISMTDYDLHMRMVKFLHGLYPKVHVTLHAGELAPGLVPDEGLCCHIELAVTQAHAERIGHGVDIMYEKDHDELLKKMAADHVMVEVNLSSNDLILGVRGKDHPFLVYRKFGVPVALSTDDEGVSRIDLTHEYVRAVQTYDLKYRDLKNMVRTSLEHSFLPGGSLWSERDSFSHTVAACANDTLGAEKPTQPCADFLKSSDRARQQWELEHRFSVFEAGF